MLSDGDTGPPEANLALQSLNRLVRLPDILFVSLLIEIVNSHS
jgi:hypothetical protein